jgi:hypothetical protein
MKGDVAMRPAILVSLSILTILLLLSGCKDDSPTSSQVTNPPPSTTQYGTVKGVVTSVSTTSAISGVLVSCGGISATTLADGAYQLTNIPTGQQNLTASKSGYETWSTTINVTTGTSTKNIQMTSSITTTSISGLVTDLETNQPIGSVKITVAGMTDYSDANGHYQLPTVPQGQQTVTAEKVNYDPFSGTTYLYSADKKYDIAMTWKMPRISSGTASYSDIGNPTVTALGGSLSLSTDARGKLRRYDVNVSVSGVRDGRGIASVQIHFGRVTYRLTAGPQPPATPTTVSIDYLYPISYGTVDYSMTASGGGMYSFSQPIGRSSISNNDFSTYLVLRPEVDPWVTVTDTDGNSVQFHLNW